MVYFIVLSSNLFYKSFRNIKLIDLKEPFSWQICKTVGILLQGFLPVFILVRLLRKSFLIWCFCSIITWQTCNILPLIITTQSENWWKDCQCIVTKISVWHHKKTVLKVQNTIKSSVLSAAKHGNPLAAGCVSFDKFGHLYEMCGDYLDGVLCRSGCPNKPAMPEYLPQASWTEAGLGNWFL